jgi:hypothetical protein
MPDDEPGLRALETRLPAALHALAWKGVAARFLADGLRNGVG